MCATVKSKGHSADAENGDRCDAQQKADNKAKNGASLNHFTKMFAYLFALSHYCNQM